MTKEIPESIVLKVRAKIREAREAYDESYVHALKILAISEIAIGLQLYLEAQDAKSNNQ